MDLLHVGESNLLTPTEFLLLCRCLSNSA